MLLDIIGILAAFAIGFLFFWASAMYLKKPLGLARPFIGYKYLGFNSYSDLKGHIFGATALWAPIIGVGSVTLVTSLGWSESIWIFAFLFGYALAIFRFWRKPRKAWEEESLPIWHA